MHKTVSVFPGDGAAFAVHPDRLTSATIVLQQTAAYARDSLQLGLRAGLVSVKEIRAGGNDVKTAQFAASEAATYAMFAGGGLNWADRQIKAGKYGTSPSPASTPPDLTGLTCEWAPIPSHRGEIISLLIEPCDHAKPHPFATLAQQILANL